MELGGQEVPLKASPSLQYNNLSGSGERWTYVHKSEVHVVNAGTKECTSFQLKDRVPAYQAKVIEFSGTQLLAIATQGAVQFWDFAKEKFLHTVPQGDGKDTFLSRGITGVSLSGKNLVFVGHSSGDISVIEIAAETGNTVSVLKEHKEVITDICSGEIGGGPVIISADIAGEIIIWGADLAIKTRLEKITGDTPTSLAVANGFIVAGFGSGKLVVFDPSNGRRVVEIAAHCRWINAIDFCPQKNTLASVGEDMLLQLWKMPTPEDKKVALKAHRFVKDALLTGVKFSADGAKVATVAYDTEKIFLFEAV
eukprot:TRINITY_DN11119_c0_g1_i1.p1 TRINITY_DN11119_c0_g1~~TRINITY_DN11119_c0_g1_i1.p1  ORF type:complete len:310 (+),score=47.35 TRINITY_DN11119_c0_g1_i1:879-1808(+)